MKRHKQLLKHDPKNGVYGDCYRTCVAIILGIEPEQVPHFCDGQDDDGSSRSRAWLKEMRLELMQAIYPPETSLKQLVTSWAHHSPDVPAILTGIGPRGVNHCVVIFNGEIFCDPHTGEAGDERALLGPAEGHGEAWWWLEVIAVSAGFMGKQESRANA